MEESEATQLILESLFDIRTDVRYLISIVTEDDDDAGAEEEG
jgi:hypothetical protein